MGALIAAFGEWGELLAQFNWIKCADPDGRSADFAKLKLSETSLIAKIQRNLSFLDNCLDENQMLILEKECVGERTKYLIEREILIEKQFRPSYACPNHKALIFKTAKHIPEDVCIGLCFGHKFLFPYLTSNDNLHSVLAQLEFTIEETIPTSCLSDSYRKIANILKKRSNIQYNDTVQWLCFVAERTGRFFDENKDVFATKSDKGGHTVVISVSEYEECLNSMLNDGNYDELDTNPLPSLVSTEIKLMKFFSSNNKTKSNEALKRYRVAFQPNLLILAKFYGLPKVHKEVFTLRPIMAMNGAPGFYTGKIFDLMLNTVFPRSNFHIKDSFEFKETLSTITLNRDDILVSFDVVSMFTSIPKDLVRSIILEKREKFLCYYGLGKRPLERVIDFLLNECTTFTALDKIYKQKNGLPMGSCISPTLARITMDVVIEHLLVNLPEVNFIKVFVDDTITAMKADDVDRALNVLNNFNASIKFTCERESEDHKINFLNMTLIREDSCIVTNWYRKSFASGRLLNYLSSHKRTTILETARHFIHTVLNLSDESFFHSNRMRVIDTLRDNCFPETLIITLMNDNYTIMRARKNPEKPDGKFYVYPHAVCESRKIKRILHKNKSDGVIFAESTRNTKINFVRTHKTTTPKNLRGNMIVSTNCWCKKKFKVEATGYNENAQMIVDRLTTKFSKCTKDLHAFRKFKIHRGLAYSTQTDVLAKYVQWKYRGKYLNTRTGRPQFYFAKLLNNILPQL